MLMTDAAEGAWRKGAEKLLPVVRALLCQPPAFELFVFAIGRTLDKNLKMDVARLIRGTSNERVVCLQPFPVFVSPCLHVHDYLQGLISNNL